MHKYPWPVKIVHLHLSHSANQKTYPPTRRERPKHRCEYVRRCYPLGHTRLTVATTRALGPRRPRRAAATARRRRRAGAGAGRPGWTRSRPRPPGRSSISGAPGGPAAGSSPPRRYLQARVIARGSFMGFGKFNAVGVIAMVRGRAQIT